MSRRARRARDCFGQTRDGSSVAQAIRLAPGTNPKTASSGDIDFSATLLAGTGEVAE
jgi:hypothetical protein